MPLFNAQKTPGQMARRLFEEVALLYGETSRKNTAGFVAFGVMTTGLTPPTGKLTQLFDLPGSHLQKPFPNSCSFV